MSLLTDLISYWKLDESSGDAVDAHGSNTLTDNNTVGTATGKIGNARDFESANSEYFSIASNSSLVFGDESMTIDGWLRLESQPEELEDFDIVSKYETSGNKREYRLHYFNQFGTFELRWTVCGNGVCTVFGEPIRTGQLTTGQWYYFCAWHDAVNNQLGLQVNAESPITVAYSSGIFSSDSPFHIGSLGRAATTFYFDGLIDEVGLWRRVLTSQERADRYNSGNGLAYPFDVEEPEGEVSVTLSDWTIVSTGESSVSGQLTATLANWTLESSTISFSRFGEVNATLADWSVSSEGFSPQQAGQLSVVLDSWTVQSEAIASMTAEIDTTLADWTVQADGVSSVSAQLNITLDSWSIQSAANFGDGVSGALNATLESWSVESVGVAAVASSLNVTLNDWTVEAIGQARARKQRRLFASQIHATSLFG